MSHSNTVKRSFSSCNEKSAAKIRDYIKFQQESLKDKVPNLNYDVTKSSMVIPMQFNENNYRYFTDTEILALLETRKLVNWLPACRRLIPVYTEEDCTKNSFWHAVSLYIFGVHDRKHVLRQLLYRRLFMEHENDGRIRTRWIKHMKMLVSGSNTDIDFIWRKILFSCSERKDETTEISNIHIFAFANILARPIIVLSDDEEDDHDFDDYDMLVSQSVAGIYLPLTRNSDACEKSPIILAYSKKRFVPLLSSENRKVPFCRSTVDQMAQHCIPLQMFDQTELQIHFLLNEEIINHANLLERYLDIGVLLDGEQRVAAAFLKFKAPLAQSMELLWSFQQASADNFYSDIKSDHMLDTMEERQHDYQSMEYCIRKTVGCNNFASRNGLCNECLILGNQRQLCARNLTGCKNFAAGNDKYLCERCYAEYEIKKKAIPKRPFTFDKTRSEPVKSSSNYYSGVPHFDFSSTCANISESYSTPNLVHALNKISHSNSNNTSDDINKEIGYEPNPNHPNNRFQTDISTKIYSDFTLPHYDEIRETSSPLNLHDSDINYAFDKKKTICSIPGCIESPCLDDKLCDNHYVIENPNLKCICCDAVAKVDKTYQMCDKCTEIQTNALNKAPYLKQTTGLNQSTSFNQSTGLDRELTLPFIGRGTVRQESNMFEFDDDPSHTILDSVPDIPRHVNKVPDIPRHVNKVPDIPRHVNKVPDISRHVNKVPDISRHVNKVPDIPRHVNKAPDIPMHVNVSEYAKVNTVYNSNDRMNQQHRVRNDQNVQRRPLFNGLDRRSSNESGLHNIINTCERCNCKVRVLEENGLCLQCNIGNDTQTAEFEPKLRKCIEESCRNLGFEKLSYFCESCFDKQKNDELNALEILHGITSPDRTRKRNADKNSALSPTALSRHMEGEQFVFIDRNLPMEIPDRPPVPPLNSRSKNICKNGDCQFYGSQEYGGFCSGCFFETTKQDINDISLTDVNSHMPPPYRNLSERTRASYQKAAPNVCKYPECDMFGNPEFDELCSQCYNKTRVERDLFTIRR